MQTIPPPSGAHATNGRASAPHPGAASSAHPHVAVKSGGGASNGASGGAGGSSPMRTRVTRAGGRVLIALAAAIAFVSIARSIDPSSSSARDPSRAGVLSEDPLTSPRIDGAFVKEGLLGELVGAGYTVRIHASADEPRYTVIDSAGTVLGERLRADEVYKVVPGLNIDGMLLDGGLMLAPTRE